MRIRRFLPATLILTSLPLAACGGGDDDDAAATPSAWAGHTYTLTTTKRDWADPASLAGDIEAVMPVFMFELLGTADGKVNARVGTAPKQLDASNKPTGVVEQDLCGPTLTLPVTGAYPSSQVGPTEMSIHLVNHGDADDPDDDVQVTAAVRDLEFTNVFPGRPEPPAPDGELKATMDFRDLAPLFLALGTPGNPPTAESICGQVGDEDPCEPCSDGEVLCMSAHAVFLAVEDRPDLSVAPVDLATRDASCADPVD